VTGTAGSERFFGGSGVTQPINLRGSWCSYHRGPLYLFASRSLEAAVQLRPVGPRAALVEVGDTAAALALAHWAREQELAQDVVPGASTVLFDGLVGSPDALAERLAAGFPRQAAAATRRVEIEVTWDGADLDVVAEVWGCPTDEVGERLSGLELVSAFCGFAPGFAYLAGLPPALAVRRRETPRTRVPAGSVALAGEWCGIYPDASPGGWQLVGHTDAVLWDATRDDPALLAPGTRVAFVTRR
jgi:KipI family sensor histidine kinase inhibitor